MDDNRGVDSGLPVFIEFFTFNLHEHDFVHKEYSLTRVYLQFLGAVFSKSDPGQWLPSKEMRMNQGDSILQMFLTHIYQTVIQNFN